MCVFKEERVHAVMCTLDTESSNRLAPGGFPWPTKHVGSMDPPTFEATDTGRETCSAIQVVCSDVVCSRLSVEVVACWLLNVPATCVCISGTDLLRQFTCCHTEIEAADQTVYRTQSQYTDTEPTNPSADPKTPGAWPGSH